MNWIKFDKDDESTWPENNQKVVILYTLNDEEFPQYLAFDVFENGKWTILKRNSHSILEALSSKKVMKWMDIESFLKNEKIILNNPLPPFTFNPKE